MNTESDETTAAELELALQQLSLKDRKFPEQALRIVQRQRDAAIPRLIEALEQATSITSAGGIEESNLPFFAIALLTEFHAKEAWPAIRKAISLPGDAPYDLFGDLVTEILPSTFAMCCSDSVDTVDELVSNRDLYEFVRWSAANAYLRLVRDGRISRDEAVQRLRVALTNAIRNRDSEGTNAVINAIYKFVPAEAMSEIREAYDQYLVDETIISLEDLEENCEAGDARFQEEINRCSRTEVSDTVELLRDWNWPGDEQPDWRTPFQESKPNLDSPASANAVFGRNSLSADIGSARVIPTPIRNDAPHVGRNDPCPCGSGKKFKKCCGNQ